MTALADEIGDHPMLLTLLHDSRVSEQLAAA
jgi:hypothetical protein